MGNGRGPAGTGNRDRMSRKATREAQELSAQEKAAQRLEKSIARRAARGKDIPDYADKLAASNGWQRGVQAKTGPFEHVVYRKGDYLILATVKRTWVQSRVVDVTVRKAQPNGSAVQVDYMWSNEDKRKYLRNAFRKYG